MVETIWVILQLAFWLIFAVGATVVAVFTFAVSSYALNRFTIWKNDRKMCKRLRKEGRSVKFTERI